MSAIFDAAIRHALAGRATFPCNPSKAPATSNGFLDATTDGDTLGAWFEGRDDLLLGVMTGWANRLVVIDIDPRHGGDESLHDLERRHGALPLTASVKTPSGGQHYWFKHPGGQVRCSAGKIAPGVDVRGDGGYVIAPLSQGYAVDDEVPMAEMPDWLRVAVQDAGTNGRRERTPTSRWLSVLRDGVTEGNRNDGLARLVGHLLGCGVHIDVTAELAHVVNACRFRPPLPAVEVDRVIDSIAAAEVRKRHTAGRLRAFHVTGTVVPPPQMQAAQDGDQAADGGGERKARADARPVVGSRIGVGASGRVPGRVRQRGTRRAVRRTGRGGTEGRRSPRPQTGDADRRAVSSRQASRRARG